MISKKSLIDFHQSIYCILLLSISVEPTLFWGFVKLFLFPQVIKVKKLQLVSELHVSEKGWFKTVEHCLLYMSTKVKVKSTLLSFFHCGYTSDFDCPSSPTVGYTGPA